MWEDGGGNLPPGWDYDTTDEGEYFFVQPDTIDPHTGATIPGDTTWDDPREDFDVYVKEFIKAAERGVDLHKL